MEAFWSLFKRGYHGTFHPFSDKYLNRHVAEFTVRNDIRDMGTRDQTVFHARAIIGGRLRYVNVVA